jgi:DNA repair ATPase RecN
MKKSILMLAIMAGAMVTSCKTNTEKEADAVEDVKDATTDLEAVTDDISTDSIAKSNDAEWQAYKTEANNTITANETRIAELKSAIKKPGKTFDAAYAKSIDGLEERNTALKTKIADYENNKTDWASFKREFDSDMTELGQAFKDLTVNNKK